ncbi:hypothetical protein AWB64_00123 [Caballeronia sordidicola]|uniref:Uncharacterized protein n=1 Tax=Caballeronia sordidicola TaxID=196367 RepID=A0A158EP99_CABSO|nr:hypothetical protein AWB64_00123 [Caballeronia sordidicola]
MKATRHLRLTGLMLKRRLDNATAAAVTELRYLRDHAADERRTQEAKQRPGFSLMNCLTPSPWRRWLLRRQTLVA